MLCWGVVNVYILTTLNIRLYAHFQSIWTIFFVLLVRICGVFFSIYILLCIMNMCVWFTSKCENWIQSQPSIRHLLTLMHFKNEIPLVYCFYMLSFQTWYFVTNQSTFLYVSLFFFCGCCCCCQFSFSQYLTICKSMNSFICHLHCEIRISTCH